MYRASEQLSSWSPAHVLERVEWPRPDTRHTHRATGEIPENTNSMFSDVDVDVDLDLDSDSREAREGALRSVNDGVDGIRPAAAPLTARRRSFYCTWEI